MLQCWYNLLLPMPPPRFNLVQLTMQTTVAMLVLMLGLITAGWCEFLIWSGIYAAFHGFFGSFGCICELGFIGVE